MQHLPQEGVISWVAKEPLAALAAAMGRILAVGRRDYGRGGSSLGYLWWEKQMGKDWRAMRMTGKQILLPDSPVPSATPSNVLLCSVRRTAA